MDVRVLIYWQPGNTFQVSVIGVVTARRWHNLYPSKLECVNDLYRIGLLTLAERYETLRSDFDPKDGVLLTRTTAEADVLEGAGFGESTTATTS